MTDLIPYGPNARLNITFAGQNGDYPDPVSYDASDADLKQIATEAIRTGYIPGIAEDPNVNLTDFVVDRFPSVEDLPPRLVIRPKTPFGIDLAKEIRLFLENRGCRFTEKVGIWTVETPDGGLWDMTVPKVVG